MSYIYFYPERAFKLNPFENVKLETDVPTLHKLNVDARNLNEVKISLDGVIVAKVSEHDIWIKDIQINKKQISTFNWCFEVKTENSAYILKPVGDIDYTINGDAVIKIISECNENVLTRLFKKILRLKRHKSPNELYSDFIQVNFDEKRVDSLLAYCLLYKRVCFIYNN